MIRLQPAPFERNGPCSGNWAAAATCRSERQPLLRELPSACVGPFCLQTEAAGLRHKFQVHFFLLRIWARTLPCIYSDKEQVSSYTITHEQTVILTVCSIHFLSAAGIVIPRHQRAALSMRRLNCGF